MKKIHPIITGIILLIMAGCGVSNDSSLQHITGTTMGTIGYNVKYVGEDLQLKPEIDLILKEFNQSLSTYISDSEISRLNATGTLKFESSYFFPVLAMSREVFKATGGTFDPSIGPLIQAWGFGPDKQIPSLDSAQVDSLLALSGFDEIIFDEEKVTMPEAFQLDFGAIAKGYAVDLVANILDNRQIEDYMVEIGGEVVCRGNNMKGESWSLGIEDPTISGNNRRIISVVRLQNRALATSGNYRNYYEKNGKIYAHIIDPRTGYNATHNLLSASVFARDCMTADAYATAFMVLGLEASKELIANDSNLDAILLFRDEDGGLKSFVSDGIKPFVEINNAQ